MEKKLGREAAWDWGLHIAVYGLLSPCQLRDWAPGLESPLLDLGSGTKLLTVLLKKLKACCEKGELWALHSPA